MRELYLTGAEYRILLSALAREEKVCQKVDEEHNNADLMAICYSIERKIYRLQHPEMFPDARGGDGVKIF